MVYGMVYGKCHEVSNALNTLVSREKPGFQALSKGLVVLLCAEVVRQGVPDHRAVHRYCVLSMHRVDVLHALRSITF